LTVRNSLARGAVAALLVLGPLTLAGCAGKQVSRVEPDTTIDLSGRWNDTDSRLVSEEMIGDCLGKPWLVQFSQRMSKPPTIICGSIRNKSMEHIATGAFLKDIERAMVNSGTVKVVASAEERGEIRDERLDQRVNADPETVKRMGRELGADYMLIGEINQINDREGKEEVRYYQVDLTLVDIQTNVKDWVGQKKIKKYVGRSAYKP
jgi:uncharacterized protein (TIGR02722 family)